MTLSFVRTAMAPPEPPPPGERGVVKWLRENLFSTPLNALLTLVSLYVVYLMLRDLIPWLMNSVWTATSLGECRTMVQAMAGENASGACWAVIRERWHQFIFGLYPQDAYWRPTLAMGLLFAALAPVLFAGQRHSLLAILIMTAIWIAVLVPLGGASAVWTLGALVLVGGLAALAWVQPGQLMWFTLLYPAVCFFLLWGGSVWTPVVAMLGFVVMALAFRALSAVVGLTVAGGLAFVAACLWWGFAETPVTGALDVALPWGIRYIPSSEFGGFLLAIVIGVTAIAFSLPLGILLALGRRSDLPVVKMICVGFIEFIRGVPLITLLFTASLLLGYFLPPGTNFDVILRVMILVTFFAAAYIAEVIRGGLAALPRGQYEAADALGLDYWRATRLIIMPQALKISIPGIVSTFIGLFKDTTLVSFVALYDPLRGVTNAVRADIDWKGIYWEPYIFVGAIFFVICFGMSRYSMYLERKLKTDRH
jgi:general L-amino acid transport system permease protein